MKMERIWLIYFQVPRYINIGFSVLRCFMMFLFAFIPFYSLYNLFSIIAHAGCLTEAVQQLLLTLSGLLLE